MYLVPGARYNMPYGHTVTGKLHVSSAADMSPKHTDPKKKHPLTRPRVNSKTMQLFTKQTSPPAGQDKIPCSSTRDHSHILCTQLLTSIVYFFAFVGKCVY